MPRISDGSINKLRDAVDIVWQHGGVFDKIYLAK